MDEGERKQQTQAEDARRHLDTRPARRELELRQNSDRVAVGTVFQDGISIQAKVIT